MTGAHDHAVLPDAAYLVLSSRLIPDLDGGYTIATLARARALAAAGAAPQLLTFDPGGPAAHAGHRETFTRRGAIAEPAVLRNLFDEAVAPGGGAASWLRAAASVSMDTPHDGREYRVLRDAEERPFAALPVLPGDPDWHLTDEPVLVYDETARVVGGVAGFRGLYLAWLAHVAAAVGDRPIVIICESRQIGELIADWSDERVRIIHTIHTMHLEAPYTQDADLNALWTRWFTVADRFDAVAWPTASQRDDVVSRFGDGALHVVVPNVVPAPGERTLAREPGLVVVLGRLAPGKRVDHAVRAFVRADVPGTRMEIWGGGAERERLQTLIDSLGAGSRIMLAGHTDAPDRVLQRASLVVTATAFEGQGMSILEALQHGVPVVAYDVRYGPSDLLGSGGGILVPDADESGMADAIRRILTDDGLRARLSSEAPVAASAWDEEHALSALAAVVRRVLAASPRR
ncbi:glycosyltransferase [Microbacterium paludicola]|uniref:glycosyltransferase n=1 Tax=Microbacterium paludicola TaxID=300019 RepID=UPI0021B6C967|nr:glycosyltransferase [Microbacterium paludicola]